jgi:hypothetical protein
MLINNHHAEVIGLEPMAHAAIHASRTLYVRESPPTHLIGVANGGIYYTGPEELYKEVISIKKGLPTFLCV